MSEEWTHKDTWLKRGKDFAVEVSRHERYDGGNAWAVYAYIYPTHPHFKRFDGPRIWQDATSDMPLHGGCTLLQYPTNENGDVTCVKVGADYGHLDDDHFGRDATREYAVIQFADAQRLFDWLTENNVEVQE